MENLEDSLRKYNLKATPQRVAITRLLQEKGHLGIDELFELLKNEFSSLSLATIYKNINLMIERDFIKELKLPNRKPVYELYKGNHSHLVCKVCNNIEDITLDTLECFFQEISQKSGFDIESCDLTVIGVCKKCS